MHSYILIFLCTFMPTTISALVQFDQNNEQDTNKGVTRLEVVPFKYEWTIVNIHSSLNGKNEADFYINSPTFAMVNTNYTHLWSIVFRFHDVKNIMLYLKLESSNDDQLLTKFKFFINNDDGLEESYIFSKDRKISLEDEHYRSLEGIFQKDDNLTIVLHAECTIASTELKNNLNTEELVVLTNNSLINNSSAIQSNSNVKSLQEILYFMYTGKTLNTMRMHKGLLWAGNKLGLIHILEQKLFSELNTENAAEVYKFTYLLGKTDLKKNALKFITQNLVYVMKTEGWMSILGSTDTVMLAELFNTFTRVPMNLDEDLNATEESFVRREISEDGQSLVRRECEQQSPAIGESEEQSPVSCGGYL